MVKKGIDGALANAGCDGDSTVRGSVSVVIPCYNAACYVREAALSALAQSRPPKEVIVVDDGSTDHSAKVAKSIPGVTLITQTNQGVAAARNTGLERASGDYVIFLDADDTLLPNGLKYAAESLDAVPSRVMVYGGLEIIDASGSCIRLADQSKQDVVVRDILMGTHPVPTQVMLRRQVVSDLGGFRSDLPFNEDQELWIRIAASGHGIYCHGNRVASYRKHSTQATLNTLRTYRSWLELTRELENSLSSELISADDWATIRTFIKRSSGRYLPYYFVRLILKGRFVEALRVAVFYARTMPFSVFGSIDEAMKRVGRKSYSYSGESYR